MARPNNASQSGADEQTFHGVAHSKYRQDKQKREDFSPSSAPVL